MAKRGRKAVTTNLAMRTASTQQTPNILDMTPTGKNNDLLAVKLGAYTSLRFDRRACE